MTALDRVSEKRRRTAHEAQEPLGRIQLAPDQAHRLRLERKLIDEKTLRKVLDPMRMTEPAAPIEKAGRKTSKKEVK